MRKLQRVSLGLGVLATLFFWAAGSLAQGEGRGDRERRGFRGGEGRGQWDPARFMEERMNRYKDALKIADDEWKVIKPLLDDVIRSRPRPSRGGAFRGRSGGSDWRGGEGRPRRDEAGARGGREGRDGNRGGPRGRGQDFFGFGEPSEEEQTLRDALENEETATADIEASLKDLRGARKKEQKKYVVACEKLRQILSLRQEARLVLAGVLE